MSRPSYSSFSYSPAVHGVMGLQPKKLSASVAGPPAPVRVPGQRPLPRVSHQSCRSLMISVVLKCSRGLCTNLLAFVLWLRKTSTRRPLYEGAVRPVIATTGVTYLQMRSVGSHVRNGERNKEKWKERPLCYRFIF